MSARGEPTIHPKLFEYVELARTVGFTSFGMSSHFRTFADPVFALRVLQAGIDPRLPVPLAPPARARASFAAR